MKPCFSPTAGGTFFKNLQHAVVVWKVYLFFERPKRLPIPISYMKAGNRGKDECLPEETNRRIVDIISDVNMAYFEHARLGLEKGRYILLSAHREENIDTEKNFLSLFNAINKMAEKTCQQ